MFNILCYPLFDKLSNVNNEARETTNKSEEGRREVEAVSEAEGLLGRHLYVFKMSIGKIK